MRVRISSLCLARPQHLPLPDVLRDDILHAARVMLRLAHVVQPRSVRPLAPALHDLDALDVRAIHFVPHLDADARELVAQQDRRVDAPPPDVDAHAREGVAAPLPHQQDVANFGRLGVRGGEEARARPGGVEDGELGSGERF